MNVSNDNEMLGWPLAAYGNIIRGDETTSEDEVAQACTPEVARRLVACWNSCDGKPTELLERVAEFDAAPEDADWQPPHPIFQMASEIDALTKQRDQLMAALEKYQAAYVNLLVQCCSNPITNAWGQQVDMTMLNEARAAAGLPLVIGESLSDAIERVKHEREQCAAEVHRLRAELAAMREDLNDARSNWEAAVEYGRERDAELAECKRELAVRSIDERYANRLAVLLECALMQHDGSCWDDGMALLEEYRAAWVMVSDDPHTFMGEPIIDAAMQADSGKDGVE